MNLERLQSWSISRRGLGESARLTIQEWLERREWVSLRQPVIVLSTCERIEAYGLCGSFVGPPLPAARFRSGPACARHLFRVASGLDSSIVGESQIVRQIRDAVDQASRVADLPPDLLRLSRAALRAGARIRAESGLGRATTSYARLAARRAVKRGGVIALVGTGRLAHAVMEELVRIDATPGAVVFGRHAGRTQSLAQQFGARAYSLDSITSELSNVDVLLACASGASPLITPAHLSADRELLVLDLGSPPAVAPEVATLPGVQNFPIEAIAGDAGPLDALRDKAERIIERQIRASIEAWTGPVALPAPRPWRTAKQRSVA